MNDFIVNVVTVMDAYEVDKVCPAVGKRWKWMFMTTHHKVAKALSSTSHVMNDGAERAGGGVTGCTDGATDR